MLHLIEKQKNSRVLFSTGDFSFLRMSDDVTDDKGGCHTNDGVGNNDDDIHHVGEPRTCSAKDTASKTPFRHRGFRCLLCLIGTDANTPVRHRGLPLLAQLPVPPTGIIETSFQDATAAADLSHLAVAASCTAIHHG